MNLKKYIKVTPTDGGAPRVMLASNTDFYKAQGCKIEQPTEEEVYANFPELRKAPADAGEQHGGNNAADLTAENEKLVAEVAAVKEENEKLTAEVAKLTAERDKLKAKLAKTDKRSSAKSEE